MLMEGLILMVLGMGVVFLFLTAMVIAVVIMNKIMPKIE
ncbi:OadG family transporter subunit [Pseudomonadota bacterium]